MKVLLWVAAGGAAGAVLRYLLVMACTRIYPLSFPWGTLLVNVGGCFLIGLVFGIWQHHTDFESWIRPFFVIGILGGFTTFSSFSMEALQLFRSHAYAAAVGYIAGSNILGIGAAALAYRIFGA